MADASDGKDDILRIELARQRGGEKHGGTDQLGLVLGVKIYDYDVSSLTPRRTLHASRLSSYAAQNSTPNLFHACLQDHRRRLCVAKGTEGQYPKMPKNIFLTKKSYAKFLYLSTQNPAWGGLIQRPFRRTGVPHEGRPLQDKFQATLMSRITAACCDCHTTCTLLCDN